MFDGMIRFALWLLLILNYQLCNVSAGLRSGIVSSLNDVDIDCMILKEVATHAHVTGWAVAVTSNLTYHNQANKEINGCRFVFPVDSNAAVFSLEIETNSGIIRGKVMEKREAQRIFENAVAVKKSVAYLTTFKGNWDVYDLAVGTIHPHETVKVRIAYAQTLSLRRLSILTLTLPVVLNPRYKDRYEPVRSWLPIIAISEYHYKMTFSADVRMHVGSPVINAIRAINWKDTIEVTRLPYFSANVYLSSAFEPDHDFGLEIELDRSMGPVTFVEKGYEPKNSRTNWLEDDVAALWLSTASNISITRNQYILINDLSSMKRYDLMGLPRDLIKQFVFSLQPDSYFNIIGFSTGFEVLFKKDTSVAFTDESKRIAINYANEMKADLFGDTNVIRPLRFTYRRLTKQPENMYRNFIILVTDNQTLPVNVQENVLKLVNKYANIARIFSITVGSSLGNPFSVSIANITKGQVFQIPSYRFGEKIEVGVEIVEKTSGPITDDVTLSPLKLKPKRAKIRKPDIPPTTPSRIWPDETFTKYYMVNRDVVKWRPIRLSSNFSAFSDGKPLNMKMKWASINPTLYSDDSDSLPIHRLAAKAYLKSLIHSKDYFNLSIEISLATGVLCEYTTLVAVDESGNALIHQSTETSASYTTTMETFGYTSTMDATTFMFYTEGPLPTVWMYTTTEVPALKLEPNYQELILLQRANGSWEMTSEFVEAVGSEIVYSLLADLTDSAVMASFSNNVTLAKTYIMARHQKKRNYQGTFVGISIIRYHFFEKVNEWRLIERKAVQYLMDTDPIGKLGRSTIDMIADNIYNRLVS